METHEKDQTPAPADKPHPKVSPSFFIPGLIIAFLIGGMGGYSFRTAKGTSSRISSPEPTTISNQVTRPTSRVAQSAPPPSVLPTVAVGAWKTGTLPGCGLTFQYPDIWQYHNNVSSSAGKGVTFETLGTYLTQGKKEIQALASAGGMGCEPQDFYNDYKSIESINPYGSGRVERIANNIDGVHIESPNKDEGYYIVIKNGQTIFFHYYNTSQGKYVDNGQVAQKVVSSIISQN